MSASQQNYLRDLAQTHTVWPQHTREQTIAKMETLLGLGLTSEAASHLIRQAQSSTRHSPDQIPANRWERDRLRSLATERAIFGLTVDTDETISRVAEQIAREDLTSAQARTLINLGHNAPPHPTAQTPLRLSDIEGIDGLNVSEGHYAVFDDEDVLRFYRIYVPSTGSNRGVGVIRRIAGDNLRGLYPSEARTALTQIDADPDGSAYRYSDTFTRCWVCGKSLTDSVSRLLSTGPTCRGFTNHAGLRTAANEVDHDPERRHVYRALRSWAIDSGFTDPRTKEDRASTSMSASRVASAWSGVPGILGLSPEQAVTEVSAALSGEPLNSKVEHGLTNAPKDTLLILVESGVLSATVMQVLVEHPDDAVKNAANDFFLAQLSM